MFTKEANESHLLVVTIATVSFVVEITPLGGTIQDGEHKGSPILGAKSLLKAFMVTNSIAMALVASAAFIHLFSPPKKAKWKDSSISKIAFSFTLIAVATKIVITIGLSFFLVFKQMLKMKFKGIPLLTFMKFLVNVMIFSFLRFTSRSLGFFFLAPITNRSC